MGVRTMSLYRDELAKSQIVAEIQELLCQVATLSGNLQPSEVLLYRVECRNKVSLDNTVSVS